ncbi:MAG TPA: hypothetical protein VMD97_04445 [Candidatus Aquilonibacter sp.]|nr:hypothetical protein [Candidatus Aquilonibacter sp.]
MSPTAPQKIIVDWDKDHRPLKTVASLQVVVNPLLRRGSPIHDRAFAELKSLGADYVRYVPWIPYPRLAVAELEPPTKEKTSWDFSLIDPMTIDFLHATAGHSTIMNFSTQPAWLFVQKKPVTVSADPNAVQWNYVQGKQLRDASGGELADYYGRLVSWYTRGGFTDELGHRHESGYHFRFPWWEVFNEIDGEHQPTPQQYVTEYDAVVTRLHAIDPKMKFVGLALAFPEREPDMVEYFFNHQHHKAGVPIDMVSYHFYASPRFEQTVDSWQYSFFDQADGFLATMRYADAIRRRLSPETMTAFDEVGTELPTDWHPDKPNEAGPPIPAVYWNASAAVFGYVFLEAAKMGIDVVNESQLVGFPSQFPSVTMLDWKSGAPNARFEALRLLIRYAHSGGTIVATKVFPHDHDVDALAFEEDGAHRLLIVNKRNRSISVQVPEEFVNGAVHVVAAGAQPARLASDEYALPPFAVTVLEGAQQNR